MTTIAAGQEQTLSIQEGQALNIAGIGAGTAGVAYLLDPVLGGRNSTKSWAIGSGALAQIGPYAGTQRVLITCSAGSVEAAVGDAAVAAPQFATDQGGNQTGLRGPGGATVSASPMGAPSGAGWLADSIPSIDLYALGFGKTPTLFFDPSATNSAGLGTLRNPYYTQAQLQLAIRGDMRGQVLGFKRGTTLRATGTNGLSLTAHGAADKPFIICPYGDALALPQITGGVVRNTWVSHTSDTWKLTGLAANTDMWQNSARISKKSSLAGLTGPGMSFYDSGATTMYLWPLGNENPNLGQIETPASQYALNFTYSDVAATGNVSIAGLDVRQALNIALRVASVSGAASVTSVAGLNIVGCRGGQAGYDQTGLVNAADAFLMYGLNDSVRATASSIIGCEGYDCLNNAFEVANVDGYLHEANYGHDAGGNTIIEKWSSCSNSKIRKNLGLRAGLVTRLITWPHAGGIWAALYSNVNGSTKSHAAFQNNICEFNVVAESSGQGLEIAGGNGHIVRHNTIYNSQGTPTNRLLNIFTNCQLAGAVDAEVSNNLVVCGDGGNRIMVDIVQGAAKLNDGGVLLDSTITGNNNMYLAWSSTGGTAGLRVNKTGNGQSSLAAYKALAAPFDVNSTSPFVVGQTPIATYVSPEYRPVAASVKSGGRTGLSPTQYKDGYPYDSATPAIGAFAA